MKQSPKAHDGALYKPALPELTILFGEEHNLALRNIFYNYIEDT
jgi:hypothetical protein